MGTQNKHTTTRATQSQSDVHVPENRYVQIVTKRIPPPHVRSGLRRVPRGQIRNAKGRSVSFMRPPSGGAWRIALLARTPYNIVAPPSGGEWLKAGVREGIRKTGTEKDKAVGWVGGAGSGVLGWNGRILALCCVWDEENPM